MNLSTRLLSVPSASGPIGDVLWAGSDHELIENARVAPTQAFVDDLIRIGYSDRAGAIVRNIPSPDLVDGIAKATTTKSWHAAVVANRCARDDTLDYIATATSASSVKQEVSEESNRRCDLRAKGSWEEITESLAQADVETLYAWHKAGLLPQALHRCPTSTRDSILSLLSVVYPEVADDLYWVIVGATDKSLAGYLTRSCAAWVCESQSLYADMTRGILSDEPTYLARRGMSPAAEELLSHSEMLVLARTESRSPAQSQSLTKDQLEALRASGASEIQLATLALNSRVPLTHEELAAYVATAGAGTIAQFMLGEFARTPRPGDVSRILTSLSPSERSEVGERLGDDCENLPWFFDMVSEFPLGPVTRASGETIEVVRKILDERLGSDPAAWEFAMTMSLEWDSNLDSLVEASVAMDVLS